MNTVKITKLENGEIVTPYENDEYGFIQLASEQLVNQNGWIRKKKRTALMRGSCELLNEAYSNVESLPGRIRVVECLEDNIPAECLAMLDKNKDFEEQIKSFIKIAGEKGADLMVGDKRILHFYFYDESGKIDDVRIQHDPIS